MTAPIGIGWEGCRDGEVPAGGAPKGAALRQCLARYRTWNPITNAFKYDTSEMRCPYTGEIYFDASDTRVQDAADDKCSGTIAGCKVRFSHVVDQRPFKPYKSLQDYLDDNPPLSGSRDGDHNALPSRIHAARSGDVDYLDAVRVTVRMPQKPRPSLWARLKSWAENLFTDPDGDDE